MRNFVLTALALSIVACADTLPPRELQDARAAYTQAASGPAAQLKPDDLLTAKQALDRAEADFSHDGNSVQTRDAAYIAQRKADYAAAAARIVEDEQRQQQATQDFTNVQADKLKNAQGQLQSAEGQLQNTQQALNRTAAELERERVAREAAEKKAQQAMADLQKIANNVRKDDRGVVITLSGAVLFRTDKYELMPNAMVQLNQIAEALIKDSPDSNITIEGYTDSQGSAAYNRDLSQKRADSVATYLASRGIARDRIKSIGGGPDNPIADNSSVEGRAQNRRVEIIVAPHNASAMNATNSTPSATR